MLQVFALYTVPLLSPNLQNKPNGTLHTACCVVKPNLLLISNVICYFSFLLCLPLFHVVNTYFLLTEREGRTGRILPSVTFWHGPRFAQSVQERLRAIFSQYSPELVRVNKKFIIWLCLTLLLPEK